MRLCVYTHGYYDVQRFGNKRFLCLLFNCLTTSAGVGRTLFMDPIMSMPIVNNKSENKVEQPIKKGLRKYVKIALENSGKQLLTCQRSERQKPKPKPKPKRKLKDYITHEMPKRVFKNVV